MASLFWIVALVFITSFTEMEAKRFQIPPRSYSREPLATILLNTLVDKNQLPNFGIMEALKIEILNPKALQLIKGMQDLNLIKVTDEPVSKLQSYLKKMRKNASSVPSIDEIAQIVKEVRAERYAKK